jgi:uncharacterized membrane protein YraQ (UPF0718 family)
MTILKKAKANAFILFVAAAYIILFIFKYEMGISSVKNSFYYIKEMLMIMPVIFVLTALLDLWVPKEKIIKYLGGGAKLKGVILSFVLGSISAGPIYAAFPLCVMLHKKGASIRNLVIILSAWAVIKVPMLLNEMKFLGFKFMALRWLLTVVAIAAFSWITAKLVKDKDFPLVKAAELSPKINKAACIGCGVCANSYPKLFEMQSGKAVFRAPPSASDGEILLKAAASCPVKAIETLA